MVLYMMYKDAQKINTKSEKLPEFQDQIIVVDERKFPELAEQIVDVMKLSALVCSEMKPVAPPTPCGNETPVVVAVPPPALPVQPVAVAWVLIYEVHQWSGIAVFVNLPCMYDHVRHECHVHALFLICSVFN